MPLGDWFTGLMLGLVAVTGGIAWLAHEVRGRKRSHRMEVYLRFERNGGTDRGQRSTRQVMAALGMTASQVLGAAKRSKVIKRSAVVADAASEESVIFECAP